MKIFRRKRKQLIEQKSLGASSLAINHPESFVNYLIANKELCLAANQAVSYYNKCSPLATAINWITTSAAAIQPFLFDKENNEYIKDHPALDLLNNPNPAYSFDYFFQSSVAYYLITGNSYIIATGDLKKAPIALFVEPSQNVNPEISCNDGFVEAYSVYTMSRNITFDRIIKNQKFRYIDNSGTKEIYHLRNLTLNQNNFAIVGESPLNPLFYEIEQSISGNIHNLSLLKRGASLSGIFTTPDHLTQEAYDRLQAMINLYFSGDSNAGRPFLAEGGIDFKANVQTNKDMDFSVNKTTVEQAIYKAFKLPLPLLSAETMTMANMDAAKLDLYRNAVLPVVDRIYAELTRFLLPYYDNSENLEFRYQEGEISALKPEIYANAESLKATGAITINDIRRILGYDPMTTGGNELFEAASNVPVATE